MQIAIEMVAELARLAGPMLLVAVALSFAVMTFESAKPKRPEGEPPAEKSAFERLGMIAGLAMPFLLLIHMFMTFVHAAQEGQTNAPTTSNEALFPIIALIACFVLLVLLPGLVGWIIGAISPPAGRLLARIAPYLAIAALVFTIYLTWQNVAEALDVYVRSRFT
jgi:cytochrome c biogenesis protein CcdA